MSDSLNMSLLPACNKRLANLCGALDANITHVARAFDVNIRRRGGRFYLRGKAVQHAAEALQTLYARAEQPIELVDVQMCIGKRESPTARDVFSPRNAAQSALMQKIADNSIIFCAGPAGTGKTHIALAAALQLIRDGMHNRLVLTRPAVEAGGERIGFLPGDMEQKVNPYLRPLHEILYHLLGRREAERRLADGQIEMIPLAFMRGLTIDHATIVLDEAQNMTPAQMKMTLTRLGGNGRIIITGDESQSDLSLLGDSGLTDAMRRLNGIAGIAMHRFCEDDIVRHALVKNILRAYRQPLSRTSAADNSPKTPCPTSPLAATA